MLKRSVFCRSSQLPAMFFGMVFLFQGMCLSLGHSASVDELIAEQAAVDGDGVCAFCESLEFGLCWLKLKHGSMLHSAHVSVNCVVLG